MNSEVEYVNLPITNIIEKVNYIYFLLIMFYTLINLLFFIYYGFSRDILI